MLGASPDLIVAITRWLISRLKQPEHPFRTDLGDWKRRDEQPPYGLSDEFLSFFEPLGIDEEVVDQNKTTQMTTSFDGRIAAHCEW